MLEIKYKTLDGKYHSIAVTDNEAVEFLIMATANGATVMLVERI